MVLNESQLEIRLKERTWQTVLEKDLGKYEVLVNPSRQYPNKKKVSLFRANNQYIPKPNLVDAKIPVSNNNSAYTKLQEYSEVTSISLN